MAQNTLLIVHHGWRKFWNFYVLNGLKYTLFVHHGWENFEISMSQMAYNTLYLSTMVEKILKFLSQMA